MRALLVALLALGCSSEPGVKQYGPPPGCEGEPDCGADWPATEPDAGKGKIPIRLDAGSHTDSAPDEDAGQDALRLGDPCYLEHNPGVICALDGGGFGCSTWPTRCDPFEDAG